ncbi:hypothetical protein DZC72_17580 [Maribacter algicola]|uniref:Glycosyltransferase n=1 Tax=Maribacter algicola TaxID=2498892 RepID=A0A3R8Q0R6_9FLAO|nr:hypothetical protein [Maribacter algicola]RRQ47545.1 hypothetical protein DZC72_17580 [Maribacter algicola]
MLKKKIALIELTTSHEECLYSQIRFLKDANYDVHLIINPKFKKNLNLYGIDTGKVRFIDPRGASTLLKRMHNWLLTYKYIVGNAFDTVVFNTASSNKETIALSRLLPKRIKCLGSIHNLKKLNDSFSQKVISKRIKDYYVLNDFLVNSMEINDSKIRLFPYYPIFFPEYQGSNLVDKKNDIWVCIPGELSFKRRNYDVVLQALSKLEGSQTNLKIIILGKMNPKSTDVPYFKNQVEELKLEPYIVTFDHFIQNDLFHDYIQASDYIMAPVSNTEQNYLKYKITGAYNLAFAYKKPLITPKEMNVMPDLNENSYFYEDSDSLAMLFKSIVDNTLETKNIYTNEKWQYSYQLKKYLNLIEQA